MAERKWRPGWDADVAAARRHRPHVYLRMMCADLIATDEALRAAEAEVVMYKQIEQADRERLEECRRERNQLRQQLAREDEDGS